jgi:hypothetical protein
VVVTFLVAEVGTDTLCQIKRMAEVLDVQKEISYYEYKKG